MSSQRCCPRKGSGLSAGDLGLGVDPGAGQLGLCPAWDRWRDSNISSVTRGHSRCQPMQSIPSFLPSVTVSFVPGTGLDSEDTQGQGKAPPCMELVLQWGRRTVKEQIQRGSMQQGGRGPGQRLEPGRGCEGGWSSCTCVMHTRTHVHALCSWAPTLGP